MDASAPVAPPVVVRPFRLHPFRARTLSSSRVGHPTSSRAFAPPFRRVRRRLSDWERAARSGGDDSAGLYLHEYTSTGMTVRGLVGALDMARIAYSSEAGRAVFPHEGVHEEQVAELAQRMEQTGINPAPILLVHRGSGAIAGLMTQVTSQTPWLSFTDQAHQLHRVWAVRDHDLLARVNERLADTQALIADGHHRYAAYLRLRHRHADSVAWSRGLAMLVDQDETPLWLGAIHRVVRRTGLDQLISLSGTRPGYAWQQMDRQAALATLGGRTVVLTDDRDWVSLALPVSSDELAVATVDRELLPGLGLPKSQVTHHHSVESARAEARRSRGVALLLPAPGFDAVARSAAAGNLLPEKATSFQPKPTVGVLIRSLRDG